MNKNIENTILDFKSNNINKLDIYLGTPNIDSKDISIFNKKIDLTKFNTLLKLIGSKHYNNKLYNKKIYHYSSNYYDIYSKQYLKKTNNRKNIIDNNLYITYLETPLNNYDFSCHQHFHILEQVVNEYSINNELFISFINKNQIKITAYLNHNIDLTIKELEKLIAITV